MSSKSLWNARKTSKKNFPDPRNKYPSASAVSSIQANALSRQRSISDSNYIHRGRFYPRGIYDLLPATTPGNHAKSMQQTMSKVLSKKRICLIGCRYEVLPMVAKEVGFEVVEESALWNINWSDAPLPPDKIMQMRRVQDMYSVFWGLSAPLQRMNHFPGMYEICRKDRLGRNLNRLKKLFPLDYNFFPETWDLPTQSSEAISFMHRKKLSVFFIIKPESGCQGKGIFLMKDIRKLSPFVRCVCQVYMPHPFLIDGYKFDQRIYVLITCVDPLRLYIYDEGIARFATVKYDVPNRNNFDMAYMHLTNYSLNKFSESYVREAGGSKRKLSEVYLWLKENGYDVERLCQNIDDIVIKTILVALPTLKHNYRTHFPKRDRGCACFEILGFDILIDRHLNPILLEVNHSPSFNLDLPVDHEVKKGLLTDLLNMVYLGDALNNPDTKKEPLKPQTLPKKTSRTGARALTPPVNESGPNKSLIKQFQHEMKNRGQFRLIYPSNNAGDYDRLTEENYCGYMATPHEVDQLRKKPHTLGRDLESIWQTQKTQSIMKTTKNGQVYLETTVIDPKPELNQVQMLRESRSARDRSKKKEKERSVSSAQKKKAKISSKNLSFDIHELAKKMKERKTQQTKSMLSQTTPVREFAVIDENNNMLLKAKSKKKKNP